MNIKKSMFLMGLVIIGTCRCLMALQEGLEQGPVFNEVIKPLHVEELAYPRIAWLARVDGVVVVRAKLDREGKVVSSVAISGPKILISSCLSNSLKWKFDPNEQGAVVIIYDFRIEGSCQFNLSCSSQFAFRPPNFATITTGFPIINPGSNQGPR